MPEMMLVVPAVPAAVPAVDLPATVPVGAVTVSV